MRVRLEISGHAIYVDADAFAALVEGGEVFHNNYEQKEPNLSVSGWHYVEKYCGDGAHVTTYDPTKLSVPFISEQALAAKIAAARLEGRTK